MRHQWFTALRLIHVSPLFIWPGLRSIPIHCSIGIGHAASWGRPCPRRPPTHPQCLFRNFLPSRGCRNGKKVCEVDLGLAGAASKASIWADNLIAMPPRNPLRDAVRYTSIPAALRQLFSCSCSRKWEETLTNQSDLMGRRWDLAGKRAKRNKSPAGFAQLNIVDRRLTSRRQPSGPKPPGGLVSVGAAEEFTSAGHRPPPVAGCLIADASGPHPD